VLVVVNVLEFSCQPNFRSNCHGRAQDAAYKRGYAGMFSVLSFLVPLLNHQSRSPSSAKSATTYTSIQRRPTSTSPRTWAKGPFPKTYWRARVITHNTARSDLQRRRERHRRMKIVMQVRLLLHRVSLFNVSYSDS
jgi:hypothetical protein